MQMFRFAVAGAFFVALLGGTVAADQAPLKIGLTGIYSGSEQHEGRLEDAAVNAYIALHGDTVAGRKVIVVRRDEQGPNPDISKRVAQDLVVQEHVDVLAGGYYTPNALAIGAVSTQAKVPYFLIGGATPGITTQMPYAARFGFTGPQEAAPLAKWALKNKISAIYAICVDNSTGIDTAAAFEKTFTAGGGKILGEVRIPISTIDFTAYIQRIKDAAPQAVFASFVATTGAGASFLRTAKTAGFEKAGIKILSTMDLVTETSLPSTGDDAIGVISAGNYSAAHNSPENARFLAAVRAQKPQTDPDMLAVGAYDVIDAIYKLVDAQHGNIDAEKTGQLFRTLRLQSPRGEVSFDPETRDIIQTIYIRRTEKRGGVLGNVELEAYPRVNASHLDDGK
jgi:branched-chain amino acid transport system substrate-binding protein